MNVVISISYISSQLDSSSTSEDTDSDRTSVCVYLTGVPVGYYSCVCTSKVSQCSCLCCHLLIIADRSLWNMRNYIHCMLCANLIAAQLVFVVGVERTENEVKSVLLSSH